MDLLHGEPAMSAAMRLLAADVVAVLPYPAAAPDPSRPRPPQVLALAHPQEAVLVDAAATPGLAALWPKRRAWAAEHAQAAHHALLALSAGGGRSAETVPARWGCAQLCAALLAGGRAEPADLAAQAARHGLPPPPVAAAGLASLAARAQGVAAVVRAQGRALRLAGMARVSQIEAAAVAPIAEMEATGMPFDAGAWTDLQQRLAAELARLRHELLPLLAPPGAGRVPTARDLLGQPTEPALDPDDDGALRAALRARGLQVPDVRRRTLAALPPPLGPLLARVRHLGRLARAYGDNFLAHVGGDGRLHARFDQIGASTGRMACHAPNLQAVVRGTAHRACFRTAPGRTLVVADYAACELRILAEMSGDPTFRAAFAAGEDVHARVASAVFGRRVSKTLHPELRQRAKQISFGLAYGMGAPGLARTLGLSVPEARTLLTQYFDTFPRIRGFLADAAQQALTRGYAETLAGRRLYLDPDTVPGGRAQAERIAKNMPIQGTNADIIKVALARVRRGLAARVPEGRIVLCVHDELVVEVPDAAAAAAEALVADEMRAAGAELLRDVPLAVETGVAAQWDKS